MTAAQVLLKKFNSAKTLPHVAIRLTKLISDENGSMQDFEKIINKTVRFSISAFEHFSKASWSLLIDW